MLAFFSSFSLFFSHNLGNRIRTQNLFNIRALRVLLVYRPLLFTLCPLTRNKWHRHTLCPRPMVCFIAHSSMHQYSTLSWPLCIPTALILRSIHCDRLDLGLEVISIN
jgi:hypothetical protein